MTSAKKSSRRSRRRRQQPALEASASRVAGIDIGSAEHWVCAPALDGDDQEVRVFGATTPELQEMAAWLLERGVVSVAMESTYVYWIPVFELLEQAGLAVTLVNARTLKNVPGRKTDLADCQWIQVLHSHGLLSGSFRPADAICRLRALQRQQANLVAERTRCLQWMQKSLDQMNVRVHRAVADISGRTGMAIIRAIVKGERDPRSLAELRDPRCRKSVDEIAKQLTGNWRDDHLFNLASALRLHDEVNRLLEDYEAQLQAEIEKLCPPERLEAPCPPHPNPSKQRAMKNRGELELRNLLFRFSGVDLTTIDGISPATALTILTEVGPDITAFPSEKHFVSWLRLCPRVPISGGKPLKKRRNGMGASRVGAALRLAAMSIQRGKTAFGATYRRIASRKSGVQAMFVVARAIAIAIYRLLRWGTKYRDIGQAAYEAKFQQRRLKALHANARKLGYELLPAT